MNYDVITALHQSENGYTGTLDKERVKLDVAEKSSKELFSFLSQMEGTQGLALDSLVSMALTDAEEQGFVNGFRLGVKMMGEINNPPQSGEEAPEGVVL